MDVSIPEAAEWFVNLICRKLDETGADHQWNDFCIDDPLSYWRKDEPTDRQGIREAAWVTAYLRCWEEIMRRRPGTLIVNCAGGARQVDLDTMALSLPLWTSDYQAVPHISGETATGDQCHSFGSLFWLPISATAAMRPDTLCFRSNMRASVNVRWWLNRKLPEEPPIDWLRQMLEQHRLVRKYYYGEFYPLTEYSLAEDVWMAYQMHRPDLDEGMVLAFRRMDSDEPQRAFVLHRLSADRAYSVRDLDGDTEFEVPGRALVSEGLRVRISDRPCSRLLVYRGI